MKKISKIMFVSMVVFLFYPAQKRFLLQLMVVGRISSFLALKTVLIPITGLVILNSI